ncbi:cell wall assembly and cell proliferation coordinating protein [Eremomyces bilateralis CBS 781.70]|uniref:Cell wall assembly and cell proliferation coordinating protein n=1 Tax=Eremomyces bilateralis CBS 781.70 TaxID=1392243 RepID=A0A6G1G1H1_9PEZI|nr:cell wall assembly and cell proliferation coordinating protein [Eremomyces bilateralis CBS 781.70]KAF1811957.1 cell wall assembly and cell proliferation coordinating protein [Eremomyces bilateralis CBS 781.70]
MPADTNNGLRFTSAWQSFWHTMTSYDRHASHDSPYRSGQHVPLNSSRHAPLTSVATAMESHSDLSSYPEDRAMSPGSPYKPGMRSMSGNLAGADERNSNSDRAPPGSIQMQSFSDGHPPPPPVSHSWKRIDRWCEDNYVELSDNLSDPCTQNDINELEHMLDCTLPLEVRESLMVHDGQERGGLPSGLLFGCMLLDCEEIVEEWTNWQRVGAEFFSSAALRSPPPAPSAPARAFGGAASSAAGPSSAASSPTAALLARQHSLPAHAIQSAYTSPHWIPLARDWGGNCIAIDLAPGPAGKYGQVILFGRDFDTKILVSRSWSTFLASVADDFDAGKAEIMQDDEEFGSGGALGGSDFAAGQLRLREFKRRPNNSAVDPPFIDILRWRAEMRYGARRRPTGPPGKKPGPGGPGLRINPNAPAAPRGNASPYSSPTGRAPEGSGFGDRGRSPSRFPGKNGGKNAGKNAAGGAGRGAISSPLARVAEEANLPAPVRVMTDGGSIGKEKLIKRITGTENGVTTEEKGTEDDGVEGPVTVGLGLDLKPASEVEGKGENASGGAVKEEAKDTKKGGDLEVVEI